MHKYRLISKKGEGTFSEVLKAQSIKSGKHVAIKCMKNHFDSIDQVNNLREIQMQHGAARSQHCGAWQGIPTSSSYTRCFMMSPPDDLPWSLSSWT